MNLDTQKMLDWYDDTARVFPWRVSPCDKAKGITQDPYRVWLSEVMLQQTTTVTVRSYFEIFIKKWPTVEALASARDEDILEQWAGLGYYARARNLIKCARYVSQELNGVFPHKIEDLLLLPGVGPYTAAAIAAIAFDVPAVVVDGNIERVISRKEAILEEISKSRPEIAKCASVYTPENRPGDYAQALMDLGATVCTPRNPSCSVCPWNECCKGYSLGIQSTLPRKAPKKIKPTRFGYAFTVRGPSKEWGLERRPDKGLLGGMEGVLTSEWLDEYPVFSPPFLSNWTFKGEIKHTFTHFHLFLKVYESEPLDISHWPNSLRVISDQEMNNLGIPTLMRKVVDKSSSSS